MNIEPETSYWFFNGHGILSEILNSQTNRFRDEINHLSKDELLGADYSRLKSEWIDNLTIKDFPILLHDTKHTADVKDYKQQVEYTDYGRLRTREMRFLKLRMAIGFSGDKRLFLQRPQNALSITTLDRDRNPKGYLLDNEIHFEYSEPESQANDVEKRFEAEIELFERYLSWCKEEVDRYNGSIGQLVTDTIDNRVSELSKDVQFIKSLKYPLKKYNSTPNIVNLPAKRTVIKPIPPLKVSKPSDPMLDLSDYEMVLEIIQTMTLAMERSPKTFSKLEEEEIRDFFLVLLNSQFQGEATGETFNYTGKTDILIRHENANIFIAECKFWKGEKGFLDTIDQLFNYITWRDTKTAILIFNKNKDLSNILKNVANSAQTHSCFKTNRPITRPTLLQPTISGYVFTHKNDPQREIILTVMVFDIPTE